jgi:hypothetical protein
MLFLTVPEIDQAWALGLRQATRVAAKVPQNGEVSLFRVIAILLGRVGSEGLGLLGLLDKPDSKNSGISTQKAP